MRVVYDIELKRPGCVLLAAAMGADLEASHEFDPQDWLVSLTPNLKVYEVTEEQLRKLVVITEANRG